MVVWDKEEGKERGRKKKELPVSEMKSRHKRNCSGRISHTMWKIMDGGQINDTLVSFKNPVSFGADSGQ